MKFRQFRTHVLCRPEPGEATSGPAAPAAPAPADPPAAPSPAAEPAAAPAEPADRMAGLSKLLDEVGKPADPPAAPVPPAPPAPATAPTPAAPATPAAHAPAVDLTEPEGLSDRAKARWADLTTRVKTIPDLERRATEAGQQLGAIRQLVTNSGLSADEFTDMLQLSAQFKATTREGMQQAMQRLDALRTDLATRLGVDAPGADPLATHPDLKTEVEAMTLTRERAIEIAKLRHTAQRSQAGEAERTQSAQFTRDVQAAAQRMDATLAARANQPGHAAKVAHIRSYFADPTRLQSFVTTYQPQQWEAAITMMYDSYVPPTPAPAPQAPPQPLRPGAAAAGARTTTGPVTAESSVQNAFARLGL